MAAKTTLQSVLEITGKFVADQKGQWDHDAWESFLGQVGALGVTLDDEAKRNLGNILESSKYFLCDATCCASACGKPAVKPKTAAKAAAAKPKVKAKAKTK